MAIFLDDREIMQKGWNFFFKGIGPIYDVKIVTNETGRACPCAHVHKDLLNSLAIGKLFWTSVINSIYTG